MLKRIIHKSGAIVSSALYQSGGKAGLFHQTYRQARGQRILVYHGICEKEHTRFNPIFLTARAFEAHLIFFKKYFNPVSLDQYYQKDFDQQKFNICLSFDDGFANNHSYVLPLLKKYKIPAVFFITGIRDAGHDILWNDFLNMLTFYGPEIIEWKGAIYERNRHRRYVSATVGGALADKLRQNDFAEKRELMDEFSGLFNYRAHPSDLEYWELMDQWQIREMASSEWVTIGAHGYYHNDLAAIDRGKALFEMKQVKAYLEKITGKDINAIAFPYGSYHKELITDALDCGYHQLLAADELLPGDGESNYLLSRMTINPFIPLHQQMHAIIRGHY